MREEILISSSAKAEINIREGSFYLEIFKKVGEIEKDGKKLPLFYDKQTKKKDSAIAKLNETEMAIIKKGLEIYVMYGYEKYKAYAKRITGKDNYINLLFPHNDRLVGLEATEDTIRFTIRKGKDVVYSVGTKSVGEMIGIVEKLNNLSIINSIIKQKGLILGAGQDRDLEKVLTNKSEVGNDFEEYEVEEDFEPEPFEDYEPQGKSKPKP